MPDEFQSALAESLLSDTPAGSQARLSPWLAEGSGAPLAVYRNTVARGWIEALAGLFPTVERLVGVDWFDNAALTFARAHPPTGPVLDDYGAAFPDWLSEFPPAAALPYLAPVARLDLAWSRAHRTIDAPVLIADDIRRITPGLMLGARAVLHPSVSLFSFDWTVPSIWLANRAVPGAEGEAVWDQKPEALAIHRPQWTVEARRLDPAEWRLLEGCRRGQPLGQAALRTMRDKPGLDLASLFTGLVQTGLFTRLELKSQ